MKINRSPVVALLWSICIPGFGQLYNRDYIIGLLLVVLEIIINVKASLNLAILYSFRGQLLLSSQIVDYQWLLFYPCVYVYSVWQAYNQAQILNLPPQVDYVAISRYSGALIGGAMGGTLGIIYIVTLGPIFGGILGMALGAAAGHMIEKVLKWADTLVCSRDR
jgi:hypothetical protein